MLESSEGLWISSQTGALRDDGRFAHLLLEAWILAVRTLPLSRIRKQQIKSEILAGMAYLHDEGQVDGLYGKRFYAPPPIDQKRFELIDQVSAARAYYEAAQL